MLQDKLCEKVFDLSDPRSPKELLNEYLRLGGFPIVALSSFDERAAYQLVEGIYHSVITNDITAAQYYEL